MPLMHRRFSTLVYGGKGSYSQHAASLYNNINEYDGSFWLIHKYVGIQILKFLPIQDNLTAIDFGCGTGRSTRWLKSSFQFQNVDGIDINQEQLSLAQQNDPDGAYYLSTSQSGFQYDFLLSMCVIVEIHSLPEIKVYARKACEMLNQGGIATVSFATEESHNPANQYLSFRYIEQKYQELKSGDEVFVKTNDGLVLQDYYWTLADVTGAFEEAGFEVVDCTKTFGLESDPYEWQDEINVATDHVITFKKL